MAPGDCPSQLPVASSTASHIMLPSKIYPALEHGSGNARYSGGPRWPNNPTELIHSGGAHLIFRFGKSVLAVLLRSFVTRPLRRSHETQFNQLPSDGLRRELCITAPASPAGVHSTPVRCFEAWPRARTPAELPVRRKGRWSDACFAQACAGEQSHRSREWRWDASAAWARLAWYGLVDRRVEERHPAVTHSRSRCCPPP
jgi:hypothetical protein